MVATLHNVRIRLRFIIWPIIVLAVLVAITFPQLGSRLQADSNQAPIHHVTIDHKIEPTYEVEAGLDGEIFPAFANYASLQRPKDRQFGTVTVSVTNSSDTTVLQSISVQIPGWSDVEVQNVKVTAGEARKLLFAPAFLPRLYSNREIVAATAVVRISEAGGKLVYSETVPVRLRSMEDMYWGKNFIFAPFIASWVTPHDPQVETVLARAKEFMPGRRMPGYEPSKPLDQQRAATFAQAKAIYRALQHSGLSYVKSSFTLGRNTDISERVRMPGQSIQRSSANCIDGVVMYASLFENLGMDPEVVLVPGHAYVAVRDGQDSKSYLYIETAITGRAPFETAVKAASNGIARYAEQDIIRIRISQARDAGIYPMPLPGSDSRHFPIEDEAAATTAAR
jgi:hypothetical protein